MRHRRIANRTETNPVTVASSDGELKEFRRRWRAQQCAGLAWGQFANTCRGCAARVAHHNKTHRLSICASLRSLHSTGRIQCPGGGVPALGVSAKLVVVVVSNSPALGRPQQPNEGSWQCVTFLRLLLLPCVVEGGKGAFTGSHSVKERETPGERVSVGLL